MMMFQTKERKVINRFQKLLRSGMDFDVHSMYKEAGEVVCIAALSAKRIVNKYYRGIISQEMIGFVNELSENNGYLKKEDLHSFSDKFNVCHRESRLLIRYIRSKK